MSRQTTPPGLQNGPGVRLLMAALALLCLVSPLRARAAARCPAAAGPSEANENSAGGEARSPLPTPGEDVDLFVPLALEQDVEPPHEPTLAQPLREEGAVASAERDEVLAGAHHQAGRPAGDRAAVPPVSEMTRHIGRWSDDLWCNATDGSTLGLIRRAYWRQYWRQHYVYTDAAGERRAEAYQSLFSFNNLFRKQQSLYVVDGQQRLVATVHGVFWTWAAVKFHVRDARSQRIADVHIDRKQQSILYTPPGRPQCRIAALLREQQANTGYDRWRVMVEDAELLDFPSWAVIHAFFVNFADPSTPSQPAG